ncbi:acyltransferase [Lachnospiraceae bacterium]|nr:acyltransferase [Lachnospiraceae bacterium]
MRTRNYGIDIFRILCCIGVLDYHIVDDVIAIPGEGYARIIYFLASFCVPGFFLMSGYLLGEKGDVTVEYCENKVKAIIVKLSGWIIFWSVIHYIVSGKMYNILNEVNKGLQGKGVLPVAWFLFTYCILMLFAFPFGKLFQKFPTAFSVTAVLWVTAVAFGLGRSFSESKPQGLWFHLYAGYFVFGMVWNRFIHWVNTRWNRKILLAVSGIVCMLSFLIYMLKVTEETYPHQYYGKWYYTIWMVSLLSVTLFLDIKHEKMQKLISRLAANTFVVYLGHLPILIFLTLRYPLQNTWTAVLYVVLFFAGLEILAEIFRKMPLLRKIV